MHSVAEKTTARRKRPLKVVKNTIIFWAVRAAMALLALLPLGVARGVFRAFGRVASWLPIRENAIARRNIAAAFPDLDDRAREEIYRDCYRQIGASAGEAVKIAMSGRKTTGLVSWAPGARETVEAVLADGTGFVWITGHVGNWELMAMFVAEQGYPVNTIAKESYDPRFTELIRRHREARGVHCIWKGDPNIKEKIIGVFLGGGMLGFLMDQDTKVPGVFADFFGREAFTPSMPAKIVAQAGIPVIAGFIHRQPDDTHVLSARRLDCTVPEGADPVLHLTTVFNAAIESEIRAHPSEWVWMHARWKTRPPKDQ
ncbi:MAG: lysophospholipid acyltransferase family protein [Deltaproteobacteria bacterium]|nr:lysophospholipid acyltransferase family protein [Deltaproteobacteria bacterium]